MESKGYSLNTIGKHIKSLKTFLNYAVTEGYTTNQKFKSSDFKVKTEITTEIYLTDEEIQQMHKHDFSKYPEIEHASDVFLFGCRITSYNVCYTKLLRRMGCANTGTPPAWRIRSKARPQNRRFLLT